MSVPFASAKHTFVQPLPGPSGTGSAGDEAAAEHHPAGPLGCRDSLPTRRSRTPKRNHVTLVACQPCQQRKHKCDGARPVCTPCLAKKRPDCAYDAAGDQRRTSALKQRIQDLETQVDDLKEFITRIGSIADKQAAVALARQLVEMRFRVITDVTRALRTDDVHAALAAAGDSNQISNPARRAHDVTTSNAYKNAPSSAATADSINYDAAGDTTLPSWMTDVEQINPILWQEELNNVSIETSLFLWPPGIDQEYPMQSDPGDYMRTGSSV